MPTEQSAIDRLLLALMEDEVSDLHFKVGCRPIIRIGGEIRHVETFPRMKLEHIERLIADLATEAQIERLGRGYEVDLGHSLPGHARFRVNIYSQRGSPAMVLRRIPFDVPHIDELGLPEVVRQIAMARRGLVLVTGATGSGKSTTLAAMIDHINSNRRAHVVSVEDPIEFLHRDRMSTICQREVGIDTESWGSALRSVFRQDPDVILIGEMRDLETISTAITGAETGHLVLSTLHTTDAMETVARIIDMFPESQQGLVRLQLGQLLRGIISQRLLPGLEEDGRRVLATEVLVHSSTIQECIEDPSKTYLLPEKMASSYKHCGMQTFDMALYRLILDGRIDRETALAAASNPTALDLKLKGVETASDWRID